MYITIDRFESDIAVVETESGEIYNIPKALTDGASEGDVLKIYVDKDKTKQQQEDITSLMDELFKD